jgi:hypothetical protein
MENALLTNPLSGNGQAAKSWLSKPDGKFGLVFGLGLLGVIGYYVLPILTTIIWNTLNFGLALLVISVFLYMITNKKLRMSAFYLYEILMKKLVGVVIQLDPFIIAEDYIKDMRRERENLNIKLIEVDKQKELLAESISDKIKVVDNNMERAKVAQQKGASQQSTLAIREAERAKDYIERLKPILNGLTQVSSYLKKVYDNSEYTILDAESELTYQKEKYKAVTSGNNALNSALKIFKGDPDKKLLLEQSAEFLKDDMANKFAQMKRSIEITSTFMEKIDLDNAVFEEKGLKQLEAMNPDLMFNSVNNPNNLQVLSTKSQTLVPNQYKGILD